MLRGIDTIYVGDWHQSAALTLDAGVLGLSNTPDEISYLTMPEGADRPSPFFDQRPLGVRLVAGGLLSPSDFAVFEPAFYEYGSVCDALSVFAERNSLVKMDWSDEVLAPVFRP